MNSDSTIRFDLLVLHNSLEIIYIVSLVYEGIWMEFQSLPWGLQNRDLYFNAAPPSPGQTNMAWGQFQIEHLSSEPALSALSISSVEGQKGAINIQRCPIENQNISVASWWYSTLLVLNRTSLNSDSQLTILAGSLVCMRTRLASDVRQTFVMSKPVIQIETNSTTLTCFNSHILFWGMQFNRQLNTAWGPFQMSNCLFTCCISAFGLYIKKKSWQHQHWNASLWATDSHRESVRL